MDQMLFEFYLSGVLLNGLCVFGLVANLLTLYVLNATREMRRQPINMFLTVLAIYDKGVLLNAILMCGIPALAKGSSGDNLYSSDNLFNATMPLHKNLSTSAAVDQLNRTSRSAQSLLFSDEPPQENQLWIDLIGSSKEEEPFSIESQLIEDQLDSNRTQSVGGQQTPFLDLLSFSNFTRSSETLVYLSENEAMAQQLDQQYSLSNWTDLSYTNASEPMAVLPTSTFGLAMHRMADFFQGYISIIYPFANISQTGSIWITCLITGSFTFDFLSAVNAVLKKKNALFTRLPV